MTAISLTGGTVGIIPTEPEAVTGGQVNGILQADLETSGSATDKDQVVISGTLEVEAPNSGTYSI